MNRIREFADGGQVKIIQRGKAYLWRVQKRLN